MLKRKKKENAIFFKKIWGGKDKGSIRGRRERGGKAEKRKKVNTKEMREGGP